MIKTMMLILVCIIVACNFTNIAFGKGGEKKLTLAEEVHLSFMRSEEKLARDVYLTLAKMHPGRPIFDNIATRSEQKHTDTMRDMILKFKNKDPEPSANDPVTGDPMNIGDFENPDFHSYFRDKFVILTGLGSNDLLSALKVGALIEELDMKDINYCNQVIYDTFPAIPPPDPNDPTVTYCGLKATDVRALENTLGNLLAGSENHLCAFISQIGPMIDPECYTAQYLTQQEVRDIINENCPNFSGYICEP